MRHERRAITVGGKDDTAACGQDQRTIHPRRRRNGDGAAKQIQRQVEFRGRGGGGLPGFGFFPGRGDGLLFRHLLGLRGAGVIQLEQACQQLAASVWVDGVARAVVFGEEFDGVEIVAEREGRAKIRRGVPAVGGEDRLIQFAVQVAQAQEAGEAFVAGDGGAVAPRLGDEFGREVGVVEQVIEVGEAEPRSRIKARRCSW